MSSPYDAVTTTTAPGATVTPYNAQAVEDFPEEFEALALRIFTIAAADLAQEDSESAIMTRPSPLYKERLLRLRESAYLAAEAFYSDEDAK